MSDFLNDITIDKFDYSKDPLIALEEEMEKARDLYGKSDEGMNTNSFRIQQTKDLMFRLLSIDHPELTSKMTDYLLLDQVCEFFISFITRLNQDDETIPVSDSNESRLYYLKPKKFEDFTPEQLVQRDVQQCTGGVYDDRLRYSYHAMRLLTDEQSVVGRHIIDKKKELIIPCIFQIFYPNSYGNLHHGCQLIDYILRYELDAVHDIIGKSKYTVEAYLSNVLEHIEHAPVAELFLTLICKPHNALSLRFYSGTPHIKWQFFHSLSEWKLLVQLSNHVCSDTHSEEHTMGAADAMLELLDRLAADENGDLLLQPLAYCEEVIQNLVKTALNRTSKSYGQRTGAMRCILGILQKSAKDVVPGPPTSPYQSFATNTIHMLPNQFARLREDIFSIAASHVPHLLNLLIQQYEEQQNIEMNADIKKGKNNNAVLPDCSVRHTGYVVKAPFSVFRMAMIDSLVELTEENPKVLMLFTIEIWRVLFRWFFEYSHNNLYHASFYRFVFLALRHNDKDILTILMKKLKLVTVLVDVYRKNEECTCNRGYILQLCNAIRLQALTLPPDAFLRSFLQSHSSWRKFQDQLYEETQASRVKGLGFGVPMQMRVGAQHLTNRANCSGWQSEAFELGIEHGSDYAKSLGFVHDVEWPVDSVMYHSSGETTDSSVATPPTKKKKKKNKKNKKNKKKNKKMNNIGEDNGNEQLGDNN